MKRFFNKPISPHLTIYSPQYSSLFSIWHRVSAILTFLALAFNLILLKILIWNFFIFHLIFWAKSVTIFYRFISTIVLTSLLYHFLNGLRHIFWDLNLLLSINKTYLSAKVILILIISFQVLIL